MDGWTHSGCWRAAAGLRQESPGSFILVVLRLQLHSSQPNLFAIRIGLNKGNRTGSERIVRHEAGWIKVQRSKGVTEPIVTWKARARMLLAAGTSSASHLDLAPISHRTSALGQWATALCSRASKDSLRDGRRRWWAEKKPKCRYWRRNNDMFLPGAVVFLKVGCAEPDALFTGEHLQSVGVYGPGTLQSAVGNTLKHKQGPLHNLIWEPT